jgi:hydroxyethylthiazole kinase-like uncharacterized protein yjeF
MTAPVMLLTPDLLRAWALPAVDAQADKEERGAVLIIAGSVEMPGAAWLAAVASLRAGAGKLTVATAEAAALPLATCLPEARVIGLPVDRSGNLLPDGIQRLDEMLPYVAAVLVGPGMLDGVGLSPFVSRLRLSLPSGVQVVLDAAAMEGAITPEDDSTAATLFTPHAGEAARLLGVPKEEICGAPDRFALLAAERWRSVVALKGSHTCVADPDGRRWSHHAHCPGLATSGSGDVLAGIIVGLAARGASLVQAAAWGVAIHARAGQRLSRRVGVLGFLASELLAEVPLAAADIVANDEGPA